MTQPINTPLKVRMTSAAYQKFRAYIEECPQEISGLGKVREVEYTAPKYGKVTVGVSPAEVTCLEIYDVEILEQTVTAAHANIDPATLAKFMYEKHKAGESIEPYKVWWHSHASMAAFFSGTDTGTIDTSTEFPYLISLVGNHAGDLEARLDIHKPFRMRVLDLDIEIGNGADETLRATVRDEIKEKVSMTTYQPEKSTRQMGFTAMQSTHRYEGGTTSHSIVEDDDLPTIPYSDEMPLYDTFLDVRTTIAGAQLYLAQDGKWRDEFGYVWVNPQFLDAEDIDTIADGNIVQVYRGTDDKWHDYVTHTVVPSPAELKEMGYVVNVISTMQGILDDDEIENAPGKTSRTSKKGRKAKKNK